MFDNIRPIFNMGRRCCVTNCNGEYNTPQIESIYIAKNILRKGNAGLALYPEIIYWTQLKILETTLGPILVRKF